MRFSILQTLVFLILLVALGACGSKTVAPTETPEEPLTGGCTPISVTMLDSANALAYPDMEIDGIKAAIRVLKEGVKTDSACLKLNTTLVALQSFRKDFGGMEKTLKRLLRMQPSNPSHLSTLGLVEEQLGEKEKAQKRFQKAHSIYTATLDSVAASEGAEGGAYLKFNIGLCELLLGRENQAHLLVQEVYDEVPSADMKTAMAPFLNISRDEYVDLIWTSTPR